MEKGVVVVLVTAPSREIAAQIAQHLLHHKLAACVNVVPAINSFFNWRGSLQQEDEVLLLVKTRLELFQQQLIPAVQAIHPYELPEIIALPVIAGSQAYLDWILDETSVQD